MDKALEKLIEVGAIREGHFILSSGKHSNKYCQCALLFEDPKASKIVIKEIVKKIGYLQFDVVVGSAMGGVIAAYELARQTAKRSVFTEKVNDEIVLRRGFEVKSGEKVLICEDVVMTPESSNEIAKLVESLGGEVVGIAAVVDRTSSVDSKYKIYSGTRLDINIYEKEECHLCKNGVETTKPESRLLS